MHARWALLCGSLTAILGGAACGSGDDSTPPSATVDGGSDATTGEGGGPGTSDAATDVGVDATDEGATPADSATSDASEAGLISDASDTGTGAEVSDVTTGD
jgi:hypothetical protein